MPGFGPGCDAIGGFERDGPPADPVTDPRPFPVFRSPVAGPSRERAKNGNSAVHLDNGAGLKQPNSGAPDRKQPRVPIPVVSAPNDRGSGSFNTTRPGGSAMDRLGDLNTGRSIKFDKNSDGGDLFGFQTLAGA